MSEEEQAPPPQEAPGSAEPGLAPEVSRRVASILNAVEREAASLREEARVDAARYLDHARHRADDLIAERQRRIAEISDELLRKSEAVVSRLDHAAAVRQGFENLVRALGGAAERLSRESEASASDFEPRPYFESVPDGSDPATPPAPGYSGWRELDEARRVAIRMAASGVTRSAVREHLHQVLGVWDTNAILDEIYGAGTGEDARAT